MSEEEIEAFIEENKEKGWTRFIKTLHYQRKLKKRLGDMWTKKQERWLNKLEDYAKDEGLDVPRE